MHFYRPPTKLWEGNVYIRVCTSVILSTWGRGSHMTITHYNVLDLNIQEPPGPNPYLDMDPKTTLTVPLRTPSPEIFNLVHNETRTVGKQAVDILLECFSVVFSVFCAKNYSSLRSSHDLHQRIYEKFIFACTDPKQLKNHPFPIILIFGLVILHKMTIILLADCDVHVFFLYWLPVLSCNSRTFIYWRQQRQK